MTFGGGEHRWKIVGRVHPLQNRGVQQINNQLIVTVTGFVTPLEYFTRADFLHQMSYLRPTLL
jgi:hypothetical protein